MAAAVRKSGPHLRALPAPPRIQRPRGAPGVVEQVRIAFRPRNRLATAVGIVLGAFVPVASYTLAHHSGRLELASLPALLVLGGLLYSAPTVWAWVRTFAGGAKALGFVLLVEGILVASPVRWLGIAALVLLAAINAIATGCALSSRRA